MIIMSKTTKKGEGVLNFIKDVITVDTVATTALLVTNAILGKKTKKKKTVMEKPETPIPIVRSENVTKYLSLHETVMKFIDRNRAKDVYKPNPITKTVDISCVNEAAKILSENDLEHYIKYYSWFHGGNGKSTGRYDPNDVFVAIPR